jgi:integrase/recombinase XerD
MLDKNILSFLDKLRAEDGLSKNTISSYAKDLELFWRFNKSLTSASLEDIKDYLKKLHQDKIKTSSIARKISVLKSFYKFLENEKIIKTNPTLDIEAPKPEKKLPIFLTKEEIFKILDYINKDKSEFGIKLSCLLEVLYASGLRVSELVSIPISAIQKTADGSIRNYLIIKGKGNKERIAPLNKSAIKKLLEYLQLRQDLGCQDSKWLFVGSIRASKNKDKVRVNKQFVLENNHLTRQRFFQMLKELAIKVGIDSARVHPHAIRHSFASHLLDSGVDLRVLQELLGHSDISTTEIYTHILNSKLQDLVLRHHPLNKGVL